MKKRLFTLSLLVAATLATLGLTASTASAIPNAFRLVVPVLGSDPNDLHVTFTGTGGTIANVVVTPAPATVGVSGGGNTIDITWTSKLPAGTVVTIRFTTGFGPVAFSVGNWTNNSVDLGAATGTILPGASPLVMLLIAMMVGAAGIVALRRRVEA